MSEEKGEASKFIDILLELVKRSGELEIDDVEIRAEELAIILQPMLTSPAVARSITVLEAKPAKLPEVEFVKPIEKYKGKVVEVQLGAMKNEGGSRTSVVKIGGARTMPFYSFEVLNPNRPIFAADIFDIPIALAKSVRQHVQEVMNDPGEWAKKWVEDFGADMVSLNLVSTDPTLNDTSPQEAVKAVEKVLQAVKVPIVVGGSGNKKKDPLVLEAAAQVCQGEKVLLNSVSVDTDYKRVCKVAKELGHSIVAFTPMDVNNQKKLNRLLLDEGLPRSQIIQDPTTAALGYGLEYTMSIMERIRLSALLGDDELNMPILAPASNAWGAREAWMKVEDWGPKEFRGPLWETITCLSLMLAGGDMFMVSHPATVKIVKQIIDSLYSDRSSPQKPEEWISMEA